MSEPAAPQAAESTAPSEVALRSVGAIDGQARCPNCETPAPARFCPECGQKQGDLRPTMAFLLKDVTKYVFRIDGKFLATLRKVFLPGFLPREYFAGRRERYERPFRFFVVINVLFFLMVGAARSTAFDERAAAGIVDGMRLSTNKRVEQNAERVAQGLEPLPESGPARFVRRISELPLPVFQEKLRHAYLQWGPRLMLLVVPLTAVFLSLVYLRRGFRYAEHFVFCLHYQAFGTIVSMPGQLLGWGPLLIAAQAFDLLYLFMSMKRVYADGWFGTLWRMLVVYALASLTMMLLSMTMIGVALAASL